MFHFKALELMNWDCYPHYRVPLDGDIILLVGPNGSGKTTFLDALRVLLNGPRLSKSRTLHHYIQPDVEIAMIKGVVTNQLIGGRRPFAHLGIYGDVDVSLVCMIYNRGPQKIDKEYFIVKGDISLEEMKNLKNGLKSLQYSRHLEEAGVSRSTLKLIALEQGETDRIGQLSPEELLQLVMDITGNREIIKRYEEARRNYRRSSQQLIELRAEYNKICQQTLTLEKQAKQAQAYRELLEEKDLIEKEKLPLAKWYQVLNQIHDLEKNKEDVTEKKANFLKRQKAIENEQDMLKGSISGMEQDQQKLKQKQQEQEREINQLHQQIGRCNSEWQRLDSLRRECEDIPQDLPVKEMEARLEELQEIYYQAKNKLAQARQDLANYEKESKQITKSKRPSFPAEIYEFREILASKGIDNLLFAEGIEIIDPKWQLAIEAFLGRDRFSLYVSSSDFLEAKKLGERHRYSNYISPFEEVALPRNIQPNSVLANLRILDKRISGRLPVLNDIILVDTIEDGHRYRDKITITVQGYRQDRRGGIFIARDVRFFCGGLAMEKQITEIREQLLEWEEKINLLQSQMQKANQDMREQERQVAIIKKREEWLRSQDMYKSLKKEGDELLKTSHKWIEEKQKTLQELDKLAEERNRILNQIRELQKEKDRIEKEFRQIDEFWMQREQILEQLRWQKEELDKQIPAGGKLSYTPDQLEKPEWMEHKLLEVKHEIEMFIGCKDLTLISLYDYEQQQLDMKKRQLERQEEDQKQRTQELEYCRKDYKDMIVQTVTFYSKAVKELAELAGCRMKVALELGTGETLVEDARLSIKVAFDQKHEVDIRDKSLSGGQDVISSLILLVALSRIEQQGASGFFIMDEHNAHLDMLRIIEVGQFLRSTKAQFVLTTPTTENMAALAVADLIMTFSKRDPKIPYAPKPRYMRKM